MAAYHPKMRLGQHFLTSTDIIDRIIAVINPTAGDIIVEIGPGRGALTLPLAESGAGLVAIEFDEDVIGHLRKLLKGRDNVRLINTDFLTFEPDPDRLGSFVLIGNLPYNITSPVMDWCYRHRESISRAVFMIQRELARRIAGRPGSRDWSPLSIFTQLWFDVRICFDVSPDAFQPPPEVTSSVIELTPRQAPDIPDYERFERLVRQAFVHRRKQLVNNLTPELVASIDEIHAILDNLGLKRSVRAEELSLEMFLTLTDRLIARNIL